MPLLRTLKGSLLFGDMLCEPRSGGGARPKLVPGPPLDSGGSGARVRQRRTSQYAAGAGQDSHLVDGALAHALALVSRAPRGEGSKNAGTNDSQRGRARARGRAPRCVTFPPPVRNPAGRGASRRDLCADSVAKKRARPAHGVLVRAEPLVSCRHDSPRKSRGRGSARPRDFRALASY
jgi:hypothetical protein